MFADSRRPEQQLSVELSHPHHHSMSLFSKASFDDLDLRWPFGVENASTCNTDTHSRHKYGRVGCLLHAGGEIKHTWHQILDKDKTADF